MAASALVLVRLERKATARAAMEAGAALGRMRGRRALHVAGGGVARLPEVALGAVLRGYEFADHKTGDAPKPVAAIAVAAAKPDAAEAAFADLRAQAEGVFLTRDLVNEPSNVLTTTEFATRLERLGALGVEVEVLDEAALEALGMRTLLAVGQGSESPSKVVVMRWQGGGEEPPLALVGKGVVFDSGGISIKPAGGMEDMTMDMGGAGTVAGAMHAIAARRARANVVGLVGLVENMPDGRAMRPGDVVRSMKGDTVEVINTDAEGRLVLCDLLWYAQDRFAPVAMVDLATLTGAIVIGLGHENAGVFANDDGLADAFLAAADAEGEGAWRMPLGKAYDKQLKSRVADMKNVGGRPAGAITAAQFLQRFVKRRERRGCISTSRGRPRSRTARLSRRAGRRAGACARSTGWCGTASRPGRWMGEAYFYHLTKRSADEALAPLLRRAVAQGWRCVVRGTDARRMARLDARLWSGDGFEPHGLAGGPHDARQPVLLTTGAEVADCVIAVDGAAISAAEVEAAARACVVCGGWAALGAEATGPAAAGCLRALDGAEIAAAPGGAATRTCILSTARTATRWVRASALLRVRGVGRVAREGVAQRLARQAQPPVRDLDAPELLQVGHAEEADLQVAIGDDRGHVAIRQRPEPDLVERHPRGVDRPVRRDGPPAVAQGVGVDPRRARVVVAQHEVGRAGVDHERDRRLVELEPDVVVPVAARGHVDHVARHHLLRRQRRLLDAVPVADHEDGADEDEEPDRRLLRHLAHAVPVREQIRAADQQTEQRHVDEIGGVVPGHALQIGSRAAEANGVSRPTAGRRARRARTAPRARRAASPSGASRR